MQFVPSQTKELYVRAKLDLYQIQLLPLLVSELLHHPAERTEIAQLERHASQEFVDQCVHQIQDVSVMKSVT